MPICKNCDIKFPNRIKINNKIKNISKRKYCLKCSPFGLHNTKRLEKVKKSNKSIICFQCKRKYVYIRGSGHRKTICNSCVSLNNRNKIKKKAIKYKGNKCYTCGYSKCIDALCFHHLDPKKKDFNISGNYNRAWKILELELDKCILLCMNCHIELHCEKI